MNYLLIVVAALAVGLAAALWAEGHRISARLDKEQEITRRLVDQMVAIKSKEHGVWLPETSEDTPMPTGAWSEDGLVFIEELADSDG